MNIYLFWILFLALWAIVPLMVIKGRVDEAPKINTSPEIKVKKNKTFRILSRLEFSESMGPEESYRIRIKENNKVVGTYYFNTERSPSTLIKGHLDKVPGKWRSCEIPPAKKDQTYLIEIADRDKVVFTRFMLY